MLKIISVPDKRLRLISKKVDKADKKLAVFIDDLGEALINYKIQGVGLSAIQVGKDKRVFVTYLPDDSSLPAKKWNKDNLKLVHYINPEIIERSKTLTLGGKKGKPTLEGCLSIPKIYGAVYRHEWVTLKYFVLSENNENLIEKTKRYSSFFARIIQHEMDHLDGILFTDHSLKDKLPLYEVKNEKLKEISID